jgi:hypothetical protein
MVVSSGPGGGGGLRVYGVLRGKKIYTIYLAMPGKHWILQFCARDEVPQTAETSRVVQMHIEPPLSPPSAVDQFDFHRSPATSELSGAMIILHGIIREDGAVINMEIQPGTAEWQRRCGGNPGGNSRCGAGELKVGHESLNNEYFAWHCSYPHLY